MAPFCIVSLPEWNAARPGYLTFRSECLNSSVSRAFRASIGSRRKSSPLSSNASGRYRLEWTIGGSHAPILSQGGAGRVVDLIAPAALVRCVLKRAAS